MIAERLAEFLSFSDPILLSVTLGVVLLSSTSAIVGTFTFLRKQALVGDAVAHSVLPGICLAFIIGESKNPIYLIIGAFITGWLSINLIHKITKTTRLKEDTAIALVLSVFFGVGIVLLTYIQHSGIPGHSGLDHILFGQAAAITRSDVHVFGMVSILLITSVLLFYKELKTTAFDSDFARSAGMKVSFADLMLTTLTVLAVVTGIQAVGVVLVAAMLITPPAAARYWTHDLPLMIILSAIFGAVSGFMGTLASYVLPNMPTGPWIIVTITGIAFFSFIFAPGKGVLFRLYHQFKVRRRMLTENVLKDMYMAGEKRGNHNNAFTLPEIAAHRRMHKEKLQSGLNKLYLDRFLKKDENGWHFTISGLNKARRLVKIHRLWETYLTRYVGIAPDHVHDDAEAIEHYITPELEKKLTDELDRPEKDPHESEIPYD
ncbi:MAG: metal ABC transporter permease [Cyclobacteriaceae bacterium]|nr:metal ABC transporter permease [Cyclobacteriaceae bacterium]